MKSERLGGQHGGEAELSAAELNENELNIVTGGGGKSPATKPVERDELPTETVGFNYGKIEWKY